eukprot:11509434-Alexandrium_andersonii.AAC.1
MYVANESVVAMSGALLAHTVQQCNVVLEKFRLAKVTEEDLHQHTGAHLLADVRDEVHPLT